MKKRSLFESKNAVRILILLGVVLAVAVIFGLKKAPAREEKDFIEIKTEYGTLYYSSRWEDHIRILQTDNTVQFRAAIDGHELLPLFSIHFDSAEGDLYGAMTTEDGSEVPVSLSIYPIAPEDGWSQKQLEMLYEMQNGLQYLLSQMPIAVAETVPAQEETHSTEVQAGWATQFSDFPETTPKTTPEQEELRVYGDIEIETPYGVLRYPNNWADYLRIEACEGNVHTVSFYANVGNHSEQHLFDVRIGPLSEGLMELYIKNGNQISLDVSFALGELGQTWEEADADIIYGMLDDVNYLLHMAETMSPNP